MGRLIDADEVMKEVCRIMFEADTDIQKTDMQKVFKDVRNAIRNQPTAYDVDGVVEQLEKKIESCRKQIVNPPHDSLDQAANDVLIDFMNAYQDAIKTVRSGGVQNE